MSEVRERRSEALRVPSRLSGNSTPFYSFSSALARDGMALALARTLRKKPHLGGAREVEMIEILFVHCTAGLAAAWVINVTIERPECGAVNGVTFNGRLLNPVL